MMMRLKDILLEDRESFNWLDKRDSFDKEEGFDELDKVFDSGDYIIRQPYLYRGRDFDDWFKYKDTEKYDARPPRDTDLTEDFIIHDYNVNCYPRHPDRRQSRFATTSKSDASVFGPEIYVVLPHKDAKISTNVDDPYEILAEPDTPLKYGIEEFYNFRRGYTSKRREFREYSEEIDDKTIELIKSLLEIYKSEGESETSISQYGCPKEVYNKFRDYQEKFKEMDKRNLRAGFEDLAEYYKDVILEYFNSYSLGYPESKNEGKGEVVYQGKYVQIQQAVWRYYLQERQS